MNVRDIEYLLANDIYFKSSLNSKENIAEPHYQK